MRALLLMLILPAIAFAQAPVYSVNAAPTAGAACAVSEAGRVWIVKDTGERWCCGATWAKCNAASSIAGASYLQSTGLSSSWGVTSGTNTGGFNTIMGTGGSATWLLSGTSGGAFRAGIQALDTATDAVRIYAGSYYLTVDQFPDINGNTIWHTGNDGAGSGLDADLVDGKQAVLYDAWNGRPFEANVDVNSSTTLYETRFLSPTGSTNGPSGWSSTGYVFNAGAGDVANRGVQLFWDTDEFWWRERSTATWREVWTNTSDGAGSGLDADLLDGQDSSAFAAASHTHTAAQSGVPFEIALYREGKEIASGYTLIYYTTQAFTLGTSGHRCYAGSNATATHSWTINKRPSGGAAVQIGTVAFTGGSNGCAATLTSATAFVAGDMLTIQMPATPDSTASMFAVSLTGARN